MMRVLLLGFLLLFSSTIALSQDKNESRKEKKEKKAKENQEKIEKLYALVSSRKFIVEATNVYGNSGDNYTVNPSTNYFLVDSSRTTIQLSFDGLIGWNGVGGVTSDGKIDKFELSELKSGKPIMVNGMIIARAGGNIQFVMYVNSEGMTNIELSGNWANTINFQGRLLTLAESKVFKGIPLN